MMHTVYRHGEQVIRFFQPCLVASACKYVVKIYMRNCSSSINRKFVSVAFCLHSCCCFDGVPAAVDVQSIWLRVPAKFLCVFEFGWDVFMMVNYSAFVQVLKF